MKVGELVNILRFKGSYEETGKQYGSYIKGNFTPFPISEKKHEFSKKCEEVTRQYCPGIIDHIEAFSESSELDLEFMKSFVLTIGLEPECSVLAVSGDYTSENIPVFARNYDWEFRYKDIFTPIQIELIEGNTSMSFTNHLIGRLGGVNDKGLAVAITAIPAYRGKPSVGVRMNIATQWVLDNFSNTREAAEWLEEIPHQWAHNFLIADKNGVLARVETAPEKTVIVYSNEFIATTNHYHDKEMRKLENPSFDYSSTHKRYNNMVSWYKANKGNITIDTVKKLMRGHEAGVCNHYEGENTKGVTIWSWISQLGTREIHVCHGFPCQTEYELAEY